MHYLRIFISYIAAFIGVLVTSILHVVFFPLAVILFILGVIGVVGLFCVYAGAAAAILILSIGIVFLCELYNQIKKDDKKDKKMC